MTIAVTAASGQLGSAIIRALPRMTDEPLVGLARSPDKAAGLGVEIRPGDYADREQMEKSLAGVDTLLLVSGMAAPDERIRQHRNVIEAARANGVRKIVYTSIQGAETGTAFSPIVQSNRQTEADIRASGLDWAIGRNGIYIEPDIDYLENYKTSGEIANCAGDGKCGYTTRDELAFANARMLTEPTHHGQTYRLHGEPISQTELAAYFNNAFGTDLRYRAMCVSDYQAERIDALGNFMGTIIAGIYEGIRLGALETESEFAKAAGRPHQGWDDYFATFRR
ncbi:NAD(P)-dependent oxidoreductase [Sphingopyxis sp. BSNA05]|uniref:SDR family oxidoreductase n=1 Tax=Sphingopyxis sp. BSNA05 TaxID=1236614 RepID=UPI001566C3E0|nr:SDR family oxidoreductase [Sphingopyxis sp. BSNA05]NRD88475.1 NAD(P)-dependent oxidoreductase [Sphingopyxis sp. BSNA05]